MSYTPELTEEIVNEYKASPSRDTVDAISERIGKSTRSIIAKLSSEGVYATPVRTTKTGEDIIKKEELVAEIGVWLGIDVPTLAKSGKLDLRKLHTAIKELVINDESSTI